MQGFGRRRSSFLRLIGWTRAQLTLPLEHLKVWEGKGTTDDMVVDYISIGYLEKHLGISGEEYDQTVVRGMITKFLFIDDYAIPVFQLHSTILFRQLQELVVNIYHSTDYVIPILPYLEQIKRLEIWNGNIPVHPLGIDLPLTRTLQWLKLDRSTRFWIIGRSFKALKEFEFSERLNRYGVEFQARHELLEVDLPACTTLKFNESEDFLRLLFCPNIRNFHFKRLFPWIIDEARRKCLINFLSDRPCLQHLDIHIIKALGEAPWLDPLIQFVLCDAREQERWRDIRRVNVKVGVSVSYEHHVFSQMVKHQQHYEKWWKEVSVTKEVTEEDTGSVILNAST